MRLAGTLLPTTMAKGQHTSTGVREREREEACIWRQRSFAIGHGKDEARVAKRLWTSDLKPPAPLGLDTSS
jgi:hypothetical protein